MLGGLIVLEDDMLGLIRRALGGRDPDRAALQLRATGTPDQVWEVLADGWLYPLWVVGATRMREVDDDWPAVGVAGCTTRSASGRSLLDDDTEVARAASRAAGSSCGPAAGRSGEAEVEIRLTAQGGGHRGRDRGGRRSPGPGALVPEPLRARR